MIRVTIGVVALAMVLSTVLVSCSNEEGVSELETVGVREYEGEKLSSISDFRENSIGGPQYIDIKSYYLKINGLVNDPRSYTYDEIIDNNQHYKKLVTLYSYAKN